MTLLLNLRTTFMPTSTALRIEWCKSKARADRWAEEVSLLVEEQRRVLAYFESRARWWDDRSTDATDWSLDGATISNRHFHSGRKAYALRQAHMYRRMAEKGKKIWADIPAFVESEGASPLDPSLDKNDTLVVE